MSLELKHLALEPSRFNGLKRPRINIQGSPTALSNPFQKLVTFSRAVQSRHYSGHLIPTRINIFFSYLNFTELSLENCFSAGLSAQ